MPQDLPYRPCVGIMLINNDGLIFTAERLDMPGAWQMPQGGVDTGEDLETAAYRELEEEISVSANSVELVARTRDWIAYDLPDHLVGKVWGGKYRGQKQHWFLMRLMGDETTININTEIPEFGSWKWSSKEELLDEIVPFKKAVYEQVVAELL